MSVVTLPPVHAKPKQQPSAEVAMRELQEQLQSTRSRLMTQRTWIGIFLIATGFAVSIATSAMADYVWELSTFWRTTWLAGSLAAAAFIAVWAWRCWVSRYTLSDAAADAEHRLLQFGQRLRTTLDYEQQSPQPAAASPSLLNALHIETHRVSQKIEWDDAIDPNPLWKAVCLGFVVACTWIVTLLAVPEFRIAMGRALVLPLEYTLVTFSPQQQTVKVGESVEVKAIVSGRPIETALLRYRPTGTKADWQTVNLISAQQTAEEAEPVAAEAKETDAKAKPVPLHGDLVAKLTDLKQDLEFVVVAGPRDLSPGSIKVLQPLKLDKSLAQIVPPAYTGHKSETVKSLNLKVLEGSNVELTLTLNRAPSDAKLTRLETGSTADKAADPLATSASAPPEIPLQVKDNQVVASLSDLRSNASFTFTARAADTMTLDPVKVQIRVQMDRKPQVKFIQPDEELVVTPTTEVPFVVDASDDVGLQKVGVMYQVGNGSMKTLIEQSADGSVEPFQLDALLMLEDHDISYPEAISYFAFAEDNYFGKPRRTVTPLRYIDIRPYKMSFQVVDAQGGACNACSVTLEELITRQRQNLSNTFAMQDEAQPPKAGTQRLLTYQKEILDGTNEFHMGLVARGLSAPSLEKAVQKMEEAVASLEVPELPAAVTKEQRALALLIDARKNLRQILKQSNSQSASACRKFDRRQRQKLRMPEKKQPEDQQQQLASARAKLEDLAKKERKWSEEAKTSCQNPSNSSSKSSKPSQSPSSSQQAQSKSQQSPSQQSKSEQNQSQQAQSQQQSQTVRHRRAPRDADQGDHKDRQCHVDPAGIKARPFEHRTITYFRSSDSVR